MRAYLHRRNIILAAISALILLYFSILALCVYLVILVIVISLGVFFHPGSTRSRVMERFIENSTMLIVTFLVLAVLLEIALHLNPHFLTGDQFPDTLGDFSDFTTRGYLTEEVFKKPKGVCRIMGLGDSFAVYPPDDNPKHNYNALLAEKYAVLRPGKVAIVNAGMPGVGPGYYWRILETCGDRIKPDLVLVGFFTGNDFYEWELFITIGHFISEPKDLTRKIWSYLHVNKTRLGGLVKKKYIWYLEERRRNREVQAKSPQEVGVFSDETFLEIERKRSKIFNKKNRADLERNWRQCARLISRMKQWCRDRDLEMVLMIFPDQFQVDEELRSRVLKKYHLPADSLDLEYPNSLIGNYCRESQIHCLDMLPSFREKNKSMPLYSRSDTHWNEAGNRLAAELIFNYLEDHKLIKVD